MKTKKIAAGVMALALVFGTMAAVPTENGFGFFGGISASAAAETKNWGTNAEYTIDESTMTVTVSPKEGSDGVLSDKTPFMFNKDIKHVVISEGITEISDNAFYMCENLEDVELPQSLREIGQSAFKGTKAEKVCKDDNRLNVIGKWIISTTSESHDDQNADYVIPAGIKGIAARAFEYATISSLTLPESVETIGKNAFFNTDLQEINFPNNSEVRIGDYAFHGTKFKELTVPANAILGAGAFYGCTDLKSVDIVEGVPAIGKSAFADCGNLMKVTIPYSVESVGEDAFRGTGIVYQQNSEPFVTVSDWLVAVHDKSESLTVPEGIVGIADNMGLKGEPKLPKTLRCIGSYAVKGDGKTEHETLEIPASVKFISEHAFHDYIAKELVLNEGLEFIGKEAFSSITDNDITLPASVEYVECGAFGGLYAQGRSITVLNPDCVLSCDEPLLPNIFIPTFVVDRVYGYTGSTAEALCKAYHDDSKRNDDSEPMLFVPIDGKPDEGDDTVKGDLNGDGEVNVTDVNLIAAHVKSIRSLGNESLGDVNGDGEVNVSDLMLVAAHVKGIRPLD
ncbi:leucine-rich repeat protein [Ruminococcus sp.]|uniref:leucine-rich repeat protein n=1 Tax=Ruminococcus sp. TaxID=41978 RepID=UPI0025DF0464|nr:leucine-rich repeat protein [Ruminococcus sp.]MBQ8967923.1 leucine-rich repeat protein [Ruminococcus sp.]